MESLQFFSRFLHVIAGIAWIGHLYFFNFVNVPLQAALDDAGKKAVNPKLMPRALWWFRWGAMITFLSGLLLFTLVYAYIPGEGFKMPGLRNPNGWILMGMALATVMWFNVWFIIWPIQKRILSGQASAEELPVIRRRAYLASRTNTYLSGPMLVGMLGANHINVSFGSGIWMWAIIALICVWLAIFHSNKVGQSV